MEEQQKSFSNLESISQWLGNKLFGTEKHILITGIVGFTECEVDKQKIVLFYKEVDKKEY